MHLTLLQIVLLVAAGLIVGFSKTGVPGTGILVVPLMAEVFGGRLSVGATLPVLITADCFAVAFYRTHADWEKLKQLAPYVVFGIVLGAVFLKVMPPAKKGIDPLNVVIGGMVLAMLAVQLLRRRLGDRLLPTSKTGTAGTGVLAGFSTMASNAAGPIMSIYMTAAKLPKANFMGTTALYFFIFNMFKVPFVLALTASDSAHPMVTQQTLIVDAALIPIVMIGAFGGKTLLPVIPEKDFSDVVLLLAAVGALKMMIP